MVYGLFHFISVQQFPMIFPSQINVPFCPRNRNGGGGITRIAGHHIPNAKPANAERQANPRLDKICVEVSRASVRVSVWMCACLRVSSV